MNCPECGNEMQKVRARLIKHDIDNDKIVLVMELDYECKTCYCTFEKRIYREIALP